jgi:AcrR family transcriptional regulator
MAGARPGRSGRSSRLDRSAVLEAALALVDREGLDGLTMRRLAAEVGVEAMALYRHADSKEGLLDGLVETVLGKLQIDPDAEDWRAQLHGLASDFRQVTLSHPNVLPLIVARPLSVPLTRGPQTTLRLTEGLFALFARAGFDQQVALVCHRRVMGWLVGSMLQEQRSLVDNPDETEPSLRLGLHHLPPQEFPHLRTAALAMAGSSAAEQDLHAGLDALLAGLPA